MPTLPGAGVGVGVAVGDAVGDGEGVGDGVDEAFGDGVAAGDGVLEGTALGLELATGVGVACGVDGGTVEPPPLHEASASAHDDNAKKKRDFGHTFNDDSPGLR